MKLKQIVISIENSPTRLYDVIKAMFFRRKVPRFIADVIYENSYYIMVWENWTGE